MFFVITVVNLSLQIQQVILPSGCLEYALKSTPGSRRGPS